MKKYIIILLIVAILFVAVMVSRRIFAQPKSCMPSVCFSQDCKEKTSIREKIFGHRCVTY